MKPAAKDEIPRLRAGPAKAGAAKPPVEAVEYFSEEEFPQGSEEWFRLRLGVPTASNFKAIMARSEEARMRTKLLRRMAGEIITGKLAESFKDDAMQRGNDMEAEARKQFAFAPNLEVERVGFVRRTLANGRFVGCSPDSLFTRTDKRGVIRGVLEIKTMIPELMIEMSDTGRFPTEHRAQCYGSLWVTGLEVCELRIFYSGMPYTLEFEMEREENFIREIAEAVEVFDYDLRKLVERERNKGKSTK